MSVDKRRRMKGRKSTGRFLKIPHNVLESDAFTSLSPRAVKMLIDISMQYNGNNNGDLIAAISHMKKRGWNSNDQIGKALSELRDKGLIVLTRQGRRPKTASLYAITWCSIDECKGKLEEVKSTDTPLNTWKQFRFSDHRHTVQSEPPHGAMGVGSVVSLHRRAVL